VGDYREDVCWTGLLIGTYIEESLEDLVYRSYIDCSSRVLTDVSFFKAFVCLRRLTDVAISMSAGSMARGMRPEALDEMRRSRSHYSKVLSVAERMTNLRLYDLKCFLGI
jgi:hypothetical protein